MIKFKNLVPSVYPNASRDFQYLCWLIDIVLNSVKHNVDDLYDLPNSKADPKLTELLAMTLGFKVKRNYDQDQLRALVAALPRILKYKGTKSAVDMAGKALIAASGAYGDFSSEVDNGELKVILPTDLVDVSLFTDLLTYILPAGMTYHVVRQNREDYDIRTSFNYEDVPKAEWIKELDYDKGQDTLPGTATMFDINAIEPDFTNFNGLLFNAGLRDNNIIPSVEEPITDFTIASDDYAATENENGTTVNINKYTTEYNDDDHTVIIGG